MELKIVDMKIPEGANLVLGQSHFIKTAEDIYEVMAGGVPGAKFAVAFSEASGDCLVRTEGNDKALIQAARDLSLIHISEPTRLLSISYAVFCLKKKTIIPSSPSARS